VGNLHRGAVDAINYAKSLRPDHIVAVHISDSGDHDRIQAAWDRFGFDIPLDIIDSPYRALVEPVERHLDELDKRFPSDRVTVLIPEFVVGVKRLSNVLHGQSGLSLKLALLERPNTVVTSVPFHVAGDGHAVPADAKRDPSSSKLRAPLQEIDRQRIASRFAKDAPGDRVPIAGVPLRTRARVVGEVTGMRVVPRAGSPSLEVTLNDGTAAVLLLFTGRRRILGMDPGRAVRVVGVPRPERGRIVLMNPSYTLLQLVG
jgi:hypothetical protein